MLLACRCCLQHGGVKPGSCGMASTSESVANVDTSASTAALANTVDTSANAVDTMTAPTADTTAKPITHEKTEFTGGLSTPDRGITYERTDSVPSMGAEAVIELMAPADLHDLSLMEACCKQVRVLCREEGQRQRCEALDAATSIANAMRAHPRAAGLQQQGCAALINLTAGGGGAGEHARERAALGGGLQAVVAAMETHMELQGIQEMAFVAIMNVVGMGDEASESRKEAAAEAGAIEATVTALTRHSGSQSLVEQGIAALQLLTKSSKPRKALATVAGARPEWLRGGGSGSSRGSTFRTHRGLTSFRPSASRSGSPAAGRPHTRTASTGS